MIKISNIKLKPDKKDADLLKEIEKKLKINANDIKGYEIEKKSLDARKHPDIFYQYSVLIELKNVKNESKIVKNAKNSNVTLYDKIPFVFEYDKKIIENYKGSRPVIIGFGPGGMFAALMLSRAGLRPIVIERGSRVEERKKIVDDFWKNGILDINSNVQFGEGGAGTFSDGKLATSIKDPQGRMKFILKTFVEFGASPEIMYNNKPHIGTDVLCEVVKNMRNEIIRLGGEIFFDTKMTDVEILDGKVSGIKVLDIATGKINEIKTDKLILAIGHSARDTFEMLYNKLVMVAKAFAVGVRVEHPQSVINYNAYGDTEYKLPSADYKLTNQASNDRGVYSFCMCPGGYVVNASSELNETCVNGMSYSGRNGENANSAIVVTVTPMDYGDDPLKGVEFQRNLEKLAYKAGNGNIPVQLVADFKNNKKTTGLGSVTPSIKGKYAFANLREVLPDYVANSISESMGKFEKYVKGFDREDAVFSGVETRTSSPVRIVRNENFESNIKGIYPCAEGAGYAGGITSAAIDGIKVAQMLINSMV